MEHKRSIVILTMEHNIYCYTNDDGTQKIYCYTNDGTQNIYCYTNDGTQYLLLY